MKTPLYRTSYAAASATNRKVCISRMLCIRRGGRLDATRGRRDCVRPHADHSRYALSRATARCCAAARQDDRLDDWRYGVGRVGRCCLDVDAARDDEEEEGKEKRAQRLQRGRHEEGG